jgi:DNA-binding NarL/FixJ family response regulator
MTDAEIAQSLGRSPGTVKNQVSSILFKLGVESRVAAVSRTAPASREPENATRTPQASGTL